jgi:hypothetical protein
MVDKTTGVVGMCLAVLAAGSTARAQPRSEDKGFVAFNLGLQPQSQTFTESSAPTINGETGSITVPHSVGRGPFIDAAGGARVWEEYGIGVGYSRFSTSETARVTAQVPNPIVFNSLRTASATTGNLIHTESALHVLLLWMTPVSNRVDFTAMLGPSFLTVTQDLSGGITTSESPPPFATVTISAAPPQHASKSVLALNAGADLTVRVSRQTGFGGFVRYLRASGHNVDVPVAGSQGTVSVAAGGVQLGVGFRVRF